MIYPPAWCGQYVGREFADKGRGPEAFDCWGLARAVMVEQFGISDLPDYSGAYERAGDSKSVSAAVRAGLEDGWQKVDDPRSGDLVVLRIAGRPWHCAVAVGGDWMLHANPGIGVVLERWTREPWKNRVEGFYRHV